MRANEPWEYSLYIPNNPRAVTVYRRTVRLIVTTHGLICLVDTAEFPHGGTGCARDADPQPPELPSKPDNLVDAEEGRRLTLVRACADPWGWQPLARNGNRVRHPVLALA
ncbi:ATP-binding protein [Streptomyces sp. NBC_00445]|uniref:ATP-binding protein n=1 Tax=Streptomyces sp. NBC_00445 TaxID=2975745 RepID=UPI002E1CCF68